MAESQLIEWKESWRDEYLKWLVGFANAQGGMLQIGVDDNGHVVGVDDAKRLLEDIPNKIRNRLNIIADVNLRESDGKEFIEISVPPSPYPVNFNGEYHYRNGSTKQQLQGLALNEFLMQRAGLRWEEMPVEGVCFDDLDRESFKIFRREALRKGRMDEADLNISDEQLLESLGLRTDEGKLTRAAVLLFHPSPNKWAQGSIVKIGRFHGGADLLYQDDVDGSLMQQAIRIDELLFSKYLSAAVSFDVDIRVETFQYPRAAIREAIYNALMHNDRMSPTQIQIWVGDDELYISNNRSLMDEWTPEKLLAYHKSDPLNPKIANAFYRAGFVETWGRGIQKMCDACAAQGNEPPEFRLDRGDFTIRFPALFPSIDATATRGLSIMEPDNKPDNKPDNRDGSLTKKEMMVLEYLKRNPTATQAEVANALEMGRTAIANHIVSLQNKGALKREGSRKKGLWVVIEA